MFGKRIASDALPCSLSLFVCLMVAGGAVGQNTGGQTNLETEVGSTISRADDGPFVRVWEVGRQLAELGESGQEEALARSIARVAEQRGDRSRLAAAFALRDLADDGVFGKELVSLLTPVCRSDDHEARGAALEILGDDKLYNRRLSPDVRTLLVENISSDLLEPSVRLAAARSLWRVGSDAERRQAKDTMVEFLRSRNRAVKVEAALALAEINTDSQGPGWSVLREIADEPSPEGRLARVYLQREREMRAAARRIGQLTMQGLPDEQSSGEFAVLRELLMRAHAQHIQGESFDDEYLIENAAKGIASSLDRHSTYFTSDEFERFFFDLNREYAGIGAFVNFDADGDFSIVRPIYSGPAYRMGLRSGDKILQVDGWETMDQTSEEIISRLKGEPSSTVVVQIMRPGFVEPQDFAIQRAAIQVPSVNSELLPGDVGYLELVTFAQNTADECREHIEQLRQRGATSFVLDVRNNTGGYLLAARDVVELFVPGEQLVVYTQGREEDERSDYKTRNRASVAKEPLAVIVNKFSASASEIAAGALQDHGRGVVVGERSFGKGSVQSLLPMRTVPAEDFEDANRNGTYDTGETYQDRNGNGKYDVGAHVKMTVARYYLPSGRSIHKELDREGRVVNPDWGVLPDRPIELREIAPNEAWKNAEIAEIFKRGEFQRYVDENVKEHQALFLQIADGDGGDVSRYPGFEEFYEGLETHLDRDDVRRWLRYFIRDEVADLRSKAYPGGRAIGDFQEDAQLQEAVRVVLEKSGKDIRDVPEYRPVLKLTFADADKGDGTAAAPKKG